MIDCYVEITYRSDTITLQEDDSRALVQNAFDTPTQRNTYTRALRNSQSNTNDASGLQTVTDIDREITSW